VSFSCFCQTLKYWCLYVDTNEPDLKTTEVIVTKQTSYFACLSLSVEAEFLLSCLYSLKHLVVKFYVLYKKLPPTCQIMYLKGLGPGFQLLESYLLLENIVFYPLFGEDKRKKPQ